MCAAGCSNDNAIEFGRDAPGASPCRMGSLRNTSVHLVRLACALISRTGFASRGMVRGFRPVVLFNTAVARLRALINEARF